MEVTLTGSLVLLEPLSFEHVLPLLAAATGPRDSFIYTEVPEDEASMRQYVEVALKGKAARDMLSFAVVDRRDGRVAGSTRFGHMEYWDWPDGSPNQRGADLPDVLEIGWTWLAPWAQRTGINREAKLLMLSHAFENWRVHRIRLRTDSRNEWSRRAIEALGAHRDGVLRAAQVGYDGAIRDSIFYSILDSEWPAARERLTATRVGNA